MDDLQAAFRDAVDARQYGVAQYYLELIRTKAETRTSSRRRST